MRYAVQATRTTLPGSRVLGTGVDVEGNVTSITPPDRLAHEFVYGRRGRVEQYRPPATTTLTTNASRTQYTHQVTGHVEQVTRAGEVFDYEYDHGRLETVTLPVPSGGGSRPTVTYAYDDVAGGTGVLTRVTHSANGAIEYGYDRATTGTLPLSETWRVSEKGAETTRAVAWAYQYAGR